MSLRSNRPYRRLVTSATAIVAAGVLVVGCTSNDPEEVQEDDAAEESDGEGDQAASGNDEPGDGGEGGVVGLFARALARGEDLTIFGDGEKSRVFVYVKDVARANVAAIDGEVPSGIYNISTQIETTINALKEILLYFSHAGVAVSYGEARKGDIFRSSLANGKAREHLRWRPKMKLMPGLMATYQYFIEKEEQA